MKRFFACVLMLLTSVPAFAADVNGYTAKYECISGGANCNVDVATLTAQACQQTITTATTPTGDWSAINWTNNVICIDKGDHTGRGTLTLGSSGTSGTRKILRYYRSGDTDDEPWNQSVGNRAIIANLNGGSRDYWIIHRLSFTQQNSTEHILFGSGATSNDVIVSRVLGEGIGGTGDAGIIEISSPNTNIWVQNSVFRNCQVTPDRSYLGVSINSNNKRKLKTVSGGETYVIPYARMDTAASEAGFCPSGYASRTGMGIDNTQP